MFVNKKLYLFNGDVLIFGVVLMVGGNLRICKVRNLKCSFGLNGV